MKKQSILIGFLGVISLFMVYSCSQNPEKKLRKAVEDLILPQLDDPLSYEFVSIQFLEPFSKLDQLKNDSLTLFIEKFEASIAKGRLERDIAFISESNRISPSDLSKIENKKAEIADLEALEKKYIDSLLIIEKRINSEEGKTEFIYFNAKYRMRSKNRMGALVLQDYLVQYDEDYKILSFESMD